MRAERWVVGASKLALKSALVTALVIWPVALGESAGGQSLAGRVGASYSPGGVNGFWQQLGQGGFPAPAAIAAVAMLLVPFALSTLRLRRKGSSVQGWR